MGAILPSNPWLCDRVELLWVTRNNYLNFKLVAPRPPGSISGDPGAIGLEKGDMAVKNKAIAIGNLELGSNRRHMCLPLADVNNESSHLHVVHRVDT